MVPQDTAVPELINNLSMSFNVVNGNQANNSRSTRQPLSEAIQTTVAEKLEIGRLGKRFVVVAECCSLIALSSEVNSGGHLKSSVTNLSSWLGVRFIKDKAHLRKLLEEKSENIGFNMAELVFEGSHTGVILKRSLRIAEK